jgi:uncharacterized membrane protein
MESGAKEKTALGLDGNLAAALGYPIGIIALIEIIIEKQNKFARFHALQSLLVHVGFVVVMIAVWILVFILTMISSFFALLGLLNLLVFLAYLGALFFMAFKSYQGDSLKLPVVGNMAENFAGK